MALTRLNFMRGETCYSQEGEDRLLLRLFDSDQPGFYVDVGAHDPMRFSNTYLFYRRGWRGVNIDATPGSMRCFNRWRRRDTNIELGVGFATGTIPFYVFNEPALNSFDRELSEERHAAPTPYKIDRVLDVRVAPLRDVLHGHLPSGDRPSFLNVDVEGKDLDVLESNDWSAFRPTYVLAEDTGLTIREASVAHASRFLESIGYRFVAKTANTMFYHNSD